MVQMLRKISALMAGVLLAANAYAEPVSDIRNTKHNFSATVVPALMEGGQRSVMATTESQICAFCHTPHAATQAPKAPIWNRKLTGASYVPYTSTSMDAIDIGQPNFKSKLCLSCHDGTLAIGSVNVLNREENPVIEMVGVSVDGGTMPPGMGEKSGFTRRIGTDLTNDHPISFTYDSAQALRDGELRYPAQEGFLGDRRPGHKPTIPLEDNQMECITCHDPHIRESSGENIKFLRVNRFQKQAPVEGTFSVASDVICLACHEKAGWAQSAHSHPAVANEVYTDAAAELREFPKNTQVWQAACFNCHDPHTVQGSRRLLREGTDDAGQLLASGIRVKQGGKPAIEETCYACHSADGNVLQGQGTANFEVPDIKTDFETMRIHMPIASRDQRAGEERHAIGTMVGVPGAGKDFLESPERLGKGDLSNRHAECTDCHNPHRVTQNRLFTADPSVPDGQGTHNHSDGSGDIRNNPPTEDSAAGVHNNLASGVLRGAWGVEPVYGSTEFGRSPIDFVIKKGDPGIGGSTLKSAPHVTREYQVCLKCHSNYAYDDNDRPMLGMHGGSTPAGTNNLTRYTNQAMEYQAPEDHKGEGTPTTPGGAFVGGIGCGQVHTGVSQADSSAPILKLPLADIAAKDPILAAELVMPGYEDGEGNCVNYQTNNHRAWHPILTNTGRTPEVRRANADDWLEPFNAGVGVQTMYCADCHGSDTANGTAVPRGGDLGSVWGPHGSDNNFLLKGRWDIATGEKQPDALCFKCHNYDQYGKKFPPGIITGGVQQSGFSRTAGTGTCLNVSGINLHIGHAQTEAVLNFQCNFCHIAIPHGWKNKNFLVNLNDVGPEVGRPPGTQVRNNRTARHEEGPYYNGSVLKVVNFKRSAQWVHMTCGSVGDPGNSRVGGNNNFGNLAWMTGTESGSSEACNKLP